MERTKVLWRKMTFSHNWSSCNSDLLVLPLHWPGPRAELLLLIKCDGLQELHLEREVVQGEKNSPFFPFLMGNPLIIAHPNIQLTVPKNADRSSSHVPHLCYNSIAYSQKTKLSFLLFTEDRPMTANTCNFNLNNYVAFLLTFYLILPAPVPAGAHFSTPGVSEHSGHHFSLLPPILGTESTDIEKSSMENVNNVLIDEQPFLEYSNGKQGKNVKSCVCYLLLAWSDIPSKIPDLGSKSPVWICWPSTEVQKWKVGMLPVLYLPSVPIITAPCTTHSPLTISNIAYREKTERGVRRGNRDCCVICSYEASTRTAAIRTLVETLILSIYI